MNITLSPETEKLVNERVEKGEYQSVTELVNEAIHRLLAISERYETSAASPSEKTTELKPLILLEGSLPANWKDDIY